MMTSISTLLALLTAAAVLPGGDAQACPATLPPRAEVDLTCALPGGAELELTLRAARYVTLDCAGSSYSCSELPRAALSAVPPPRAGLAHCGLPSNESLACTLRALGAPTASALTLRAVPGGAAAQLRPQHVAGLSNVTMLTLVGAAADAPAAPLPTAALTTLPVLRRLTVREARVVLTPGALDGVTALEYLEVSASEVRKLEAGTFRGLTALRTLSLWGNELNELSPGVLEGLSILDTLDLSSNPLRSLGAGALKAAARLRVLRLVDVELDALDEAALRGLDALEELMLLDARVPPQIGARALALPKLHSVQIERCGVAELPADALEGARALRALSLSHNALTTCPARLLRDAGELRALNLSHNALRALTPALFAPLLRLEELNLDYNLLEEFPDDLFATAAALRSLSARHNRLHTIAPAAMRGARALQTLDLAQNQLTLRPEGERGGAVEGGEGGSEGDGAYDVEFGPQSPLDALLQLQRLDLSDNLVRDVFSDWRFVLLSLKLLNLTHNRVQRLTDADVNFLSTDVVVDLTYNNITTVQLSEVLRFPESEEEEANGVGGARLLLDGNPFECDCHAYSLLRRLNDTHSHPRLDPGAAACAAPPALAGTALRAAPPAALVCSLPACPPACSCTLRPAAGALELDCAESPAPADVPTPALFGVARLVLRLRSAPLSLDLSLPLHELVLAGLGLTELPPGPAPLTLELLDLTDNKLTAVPPGPGPKLRLAGNPFACDCTHAPALRELQRSPQRVADWRYVTCSRGSPLWRVDAVRLCAGRSAAWAAGVGGALASLGLLASTSAVLWLRYRREVKVYLFARGWCGWLTRSDEPAARYDVFVSFSHEDEALVARELVPALEARGYRLCVHYRDWAPGESIAAHVARSVREARRTLVVVSRGFVRSEWARAEFREAHARALREGRARVVVLLLGELPAAPDDELRVYLRTNTYLKWGDPWFWRKLQYALPHRPLGARKEPVPPGTLSAGALQAALAATLSDKLTDKLDPRLCLAPPAPAL